ncbi:hypothetical protein G9A89_021951 [Geosiphon pyriformis]|nr:hypothetical protein G9A89_021951 [Geosiphon pyriformis]
MTSHSGRSKQHYTSILIETKSPIPKKNKQGLQKPKPIPKASTTPNNLITPAKSTIVQTSQNSSQNAEQNLCTKHTIFEAATLAFLKTEKDSQYQSLKTKPLHKAVLIVVLEKQEDNNCKTHEVE